MNFNFQRARAFFCCDPAPAQGSWAGPGMSTQRTQQRSQLPFHLLFGPALIAACIEIEPKFGHVELAGPMITSAASSAGSANTNQARRYISKICQLSPSRTVIPDSFKVFTFLFTLSTKFRIQKHHQIFQFIQWLLIRLSLSNVQYSKNDAEVVLRTSV